MTKSPGWITEAVQQDGMRNRWFRGVQHAACGRDDWARINSATAGGGTRWACRPCRTENLARWNAELFPRIVAAYGGGCAVCGETDLDMLVADHVNDDGAEHRRELSRTRGGSPGRPASGRMVHADIVRRGFPPEFQILCANHNQKKARQRLREQMAAPNKETHPHDQTRPPDRPRRLPG